MDELADALETFRATVPLSEQDVQERDLAVLHALERGVPRADVRRLTGLSEVALELAVARASFFRCAPDLVDR